MPEGETHLVEWMQKMNKVVDGKLTYQYHKLEAALPWVKERRIAVDVGAHCGLWSMHLVKLFEWVHAFEPVARHRDCFMMNVAKPNHTLYPCALGTEEKMVNIYTAPTSSGDSWVDGEGDIPMRRLDDWDFMDVDFVKLDCEGYEYFALKGGEQMLMRCKPCVLVEQKSGHAQKFGLEETQAVKFLQGHGAKLRKVISGDYILSWN